jgi:hypothetical protein
LLLTRIFHVEFNDFYVNQSLVGQTIEHFLFGLFATLQPDVLLLLLLLTANRLDAQLEALPKRK